MNIRNKISISISQDRCFYHVFGDNKKYYDLYSLQTKHPELTKYCVENKLQLQRKLLKLKELLENAYWERMNFLMKNKEINKQMIGIMNCLDSMTYNHSVRVMLISAEIEKHLGMKNHKLMYAAMFHDVGKMYIPFNILDKNIRLTKLERQIMDLHPYIGYSILSELGLNEDICMIVLYHHGFHPITLQDVEHYDKDNIYSKTIILHTIDAFEALTSDRPYHRGVTSKEALKILTKEGGYDTKVLEYITEVACKDNISASAIHRIGQEYNKFEFAKKLIMEMEL